MKNFKFKLCLILLVIGSILISLDYNISTDLQYPKEYRNSNAAIGEFQYYTIASTYGAKCTYKLLEDTKGDGLYAGAKVIDKVFYQNIRIDILSDFVGFLLIAVACILLRSAGSKFRFAAVSAICGCILHGIHMALPFFLNGILLCNMVLMIGIFYLVCTILTTFLFTYGLLGMCQDVCCRDERKWCKLCWFVTFVLQVLVTFVFWLGADFGMLLNVGRFFEGVLGFFVILFWIILYRTKDYLEASYQNSLHSH